MVSLLPFPEILHIFIYDFIITFDSSIFFLWIKRFFLCWYMVPPDFWVWVEALLTTVYLVNCLSSPKLQNHSSYFWLHGIHPSYNHLCPFGCVCFILLPHEQNKFSAQSVKCAFLGYALTQKGFMCYDPIVKRIRITWNMVFFENQYFFKHISHMLHLRPYLFFLVFPKLLPRQGLSQGLSMWDEVLKIMHKDCLFRHLI